MPVRRLNPAARPFYVGVLDLWTTDRNFNNGSQTDLP
jgi:hypothetical protein